MTVEHSSGFPVNNTMVPKSFENDPFHGNPTVQSYSTKIQTFMRTLCNIQKQEGYLIIFIFGRSPIPFPSIVNYYLIMENDEFRALVYLIDPMQSELYNNSFSRHELEAVRTRRDNHYFTWKRLLIKDGKRLCENKMRAVEEAKYYLTFHTKNENDGSFEEQLQIEIKSCEYEYADSIGMFALRDFKDKEIITFAVAEEKYQGQIADPTDLLLGYSYMRQFFHLDGDGIANAVCTKHGFIRAITDIPLGSEIILTPRVLSPYHYLNNYVCQKYPEKTYKKGNQGLVRDFEYDHDRNNMVLFTMQYESSDDSTTQLVERVNEEELRFRLIYGRLSNNDHTAQNNGDKNSNDPDDDEH